MIGKLHQEIVNSIFETIPIEFSFVDKNGKLLAHNKHEIKIFKLYF